MFRLDLKPLASSFPPLAWCVKLNKKSKWMTAFYGSRVEIGEDFMVEGIWDSSFSSMNFHTRQHFWGSGLKLTDRGAVFSASVALVDRLIYALSDSELVCSNSLPLLLAVTRTRLSLDHDYTTECHSIMAGKLRYQRSFVVQNSGFQINQLYGENLVVTENDFWHEPRIAQPSSLRSFDEYSEQMRTLIHRLMMNLRDKGRTHSTRLLTTTSTGYDALAVATLVRNFGVDKCCTTTNENGALENGVPLTKALSLNSLILTHVVPDYHNELYALAGTLDGREGIFEDLFQYVSTQKDTAALFSGYHGDKVWDKHTQGRFLNSEVLRGDTSGLNLSEIRLFAGFINVAIPFAFAEQIKDIVAISNSKDMVSWSIGGNYDRPIPRRMAETVGVPRRMFGQNKRVVMDYNLWPRNPQLRLELEQYLSETFGFGVLKKTLHELTRQIDVHLLPPLKKVGLLDENFSTNKKFWRDHKQLANRIYVWVVNSITERYKEVFD